MPVLTDKSTLSAQLWNWVMRFDTEDVIKSRITCEQWIKLMNEIMGQDVYLAARRFEEMGLRPNEELISSMTRDLIVEFADHVIHEEQHRYLKRQ